MLQESARHTMHPFESYCPLERVAEPLRFSRLAEMIEDVRATQTKLSDSQLTYFYFESSIHRLSMLRSMKVKQTYIF